MLVSAVRKHFGLDAKTSGRIVTHKHAKEIMSNPQPGVATQRLAKKWVIVGASPISDSSDMLQVDRIWKPNFEDYHKNPSIDASSFALPTAKNHKLYGHTITAEPGVQLVLFFPRCILGSLNPNARSVRHQG